MVENDTPVEVVSQAAMARPDHKVYDSIIVTRNRYYHGLVSVRQLLDAITSVQVEAARFANLLTGLSGNRYIDTTDRQDRPVRLPLMTISLALIDCQPGQYNNLEELARVSAELKKYAKSKEGSVFVKERRQRKAQTRPLSPRPVI